MMQSLSVGLQKLLENSVQTINLVGHGGEKFTPEMGDYGIKDYEKDVLEKLPEGEIVIVGHSMGSLCGFNLAQRYPSKVRGVVLIDPTMCGGLADIRVAKALLSKPGRYILPVLSNGLFVPERDDAKLMLYNGQESSHLDSIARQPASGRAIREMLLGRLSGQTERPCALVVAGESRLSPTRQKIAWAKQVHAVSVATLAESHCGILENSILPDIVSGMVQRVSV